MAEKATPMWARLLEIIAGIIVLVLAVYIIFNPNIAINTAQIHTRDRTDHLRSCSSDPRSYFRGP